MSAAPRNVVTGFNHNVRHRGKVYHVQTEDSGADIAHYITHNENPSNSFANGNQWQRWTFLDRAHDKT